ncbi:MAG: hypothetical protein P1V97_12430 [Planctomycetota bacterium]|nr:hypothetical protein [Planctomycetota bacterium]
MSDETDPKDIEDRLLEAALEVTLGQQAGDALEQRILEAAALEQARAQSLQKKAGPPKKSSPKSKRRRRAAPEGRSWPYLLGAIILLAVGAMIVSQSSSPKPDPAPKKVTPPAKRPEKKDEPEKKAVPEKKPAPVKKTPKQPEPKDPPKDDPFKTKPIKKTPSKTDPETPDIDPIPKKEQGLPPTQGPEEELVIMASVQSGKRLQWKTLGQKGETSWQTMKLGQNIYSNTQLRVQSGQATVTLKDGTAIQFDGQLTLSAKDKMPRINLEKKSLHIENGRAKAALPVTIGTQQALLSQGNFFIHRQSKQRVLFCCLDGQIQSGDLKLTPGQSLEFRSGRPGKKKAINGPLLAKKYRFFRGLKAQVLWRHDFAKSKPDALTEGELRQGKALARGPAGSIKLVWNPDIPYSPGMTVRFRARLTNMRSFYFQIWAPELQKNWRRDLMIAKKQWLTLEFPIENLHPFKEEKVFIQKGATLRNIHFKLTDKENAVLEIEWVELLRRPALIR